MKRRNPHRSKRKLSERRKPKPPSATLINESLNQAVAHQQAGRLADAATQYRAVLEQQPDHVDALHMLGIISHQLGDSDRALKLIGKALALQPDGAEMHNNLAIILNDTGHADTAIKHYDRALALQPAYPEAFNNRGNALRAVGRLDEARTDFERAISLNPNYTQAHNNLGIVLIDMELPAAAKAALQTAVSQIPNYADAWSNLGAALQDLGEIDAALNNLEKALTLDPNNAQAINNRGHILQELDQLTEAEACFRRAIELHPTYADAHINLGLTQQMQNHPTDAIETLRLGINAHPEHSDLHWNLALALLQNGDYQEGWQEYEWRWRMPKFTIFTRQIDAPLWQGEDMAGQTLFIHAEQGLGDTLHFVRYLPLAAARSQAKIIFECAKPLAPLFAERENWQDITIVTQPPTTCDAYLPLLSLPRVLGTTIETIPNEIPYLKILAERTPEWTKQIAAVDADAKVCKVGLVWAGNIKYQNDFRRSIPFDLVERIIDTDKCRFFSLQIERVESAASQFASGALIDIGAGFIDFADTAAAVEQLDLIITVDTSVAHLAGALGKPVWTMLPKASDWRWLLGRDDSPWYPTMRLFRQPTVGDWGSVINEVTQSLTAFAKQVAR
jgi:tetratricopeptide (TPR) repeat protein